MGSILVKNDQENQTESSSQPIPKRMSACTKDKIMATIALGTIFATQSAFLFWLDSDIKKSTLKGNWYTATMAFAFLNALIAVFAFGNSYRMYYSSKKTITPKNQ